MAFRNIVVTNLYYSINRYKNPKKKTLNTFWIYNELILFFDKINVVCVVINKKG